MLSVAGVLIGAVYFVLFFLTFAKLGRAEADRLVSAFAGKTYFAEAALLAAVLLVPTAVVAIILAVIGFAWLGRETWLQHRRMRELAFDATFERRMFRISFLVPLAIACLLAGKFWPNSYGAA
jgi:hypothetical protein